MYEIFLTNFQIHAIALQFITSYSTLTQWLPLVFVALAASMLIVALYYMAGFAINNKKMRETAVYEFGQAIGTGILAILIIAIMAFASTIFINMIPPATMQSICTILGGSQVNLLNSQYTGSLVSAQANSPTQVICNNIIGTASAGSGNIDITSNLDYGLASVFMIEANMTNQTVGNMNSLFVFSNWIGFLSSFVGGSELCDPVDCISGGAPAFRVDYSYAPLAGYDFLTKAALTPLQTQAIFMFEMNIMQLIIVVLMLYSWPYLIAAGLILRATIYGRKIGGFLFAVAFTAVIVYPLIFMFEYSALGSGNLSPIGIPANEIPYTFANTPPTAFQGTGTTSTTFNDLNINEIVGGNTVMYRFNAFVYPKLNDVIYYDGCWPLGGSVLASEGTFAAFYLIPLAGLGVGLGNLLGTGLGFVSSVPIVPTTCGPAQAMQTFFDIINVYAIMSVEGVILPILNILIALVSIRGISGLLGGDTDIVGLGKLV